MTCPRCEADTRVIETVSYDTYVRRRRECKDCGHRFTTRERHPHEHTEESDGKHPSP